MEFRILGPLEAGDGGASPGLGPRKQRALLARLLLDANRTVSVERLVDDLWGEDLPDSAVKMVQIYVSGLRKVLPEGVIRTRPPGYSIELEGEALDLQRFERLRAEGTAALAAGDAAAAAERLRAALSLWRGAALVEFTEPFALQERNRLEELQLGCLEERIEADLALGRHADLVAELESLAGRHPLRERLRGQRMLALYRSGRQAEALEAYQSFRRRLDEELGIEPSSRLRELEHAILVQSPSLDPEPSREPAGAVTQTRQLPAAATGVEAPIGRQGALDALGRALGGALEGRRRLVLISGEAGIGKSALAEAFLELAKEAEPSVLVGRGQCVEHHGPGEPYLPVLDAIAHITRGDEREQVVALLADRAPTWLVQMPWLVDRAQMESLQLRTRGATRERMLREMIEAIETWASTTGVVCLIEDLSWCDPSTLDLLGACMRRPQPAKVLLIATAEPGTGPQDGPVQSLMRELSLRGAGEQLSLTGLTEADVVEYLARRLPDADLPDEVAGVLQRRTGGNPLFMRHLLDHWIDTGALVVEAGGNARLPAGVDGLGAGVPASLRAALEHRLDALEDAERDLLLPAALAGREFTAAAVAAGLDRPEPDVEERCEAVSARTRLIERLGSAEWPDGTLSARYGFIHSLYREVLLASLPHDRRIALHRRIGHRLEEAYGSRGAEIASELAFHFVACGETDGAVRFLQAAAQQAFARNAYPEGVEHTRAALAAAATLPEGPSRSRSEVELLSQLGQALVAIDGWSAPEAEDSLLRARDLAQGLGDNEPLISVLVALGTLYEVRGDYSRAREMADAAVAMSPDDGAGRELESQELLACSLFHQGAFAMALRHADRGAGLFETDEQASGHYDTFPATLGDNAGVSCHDWAALAMWFLGRPDQALERARRALGLAEDASRVYSLATARGQLAIVHQCRREPQATLEWADATIDVAADRGYAYRVAMGRVLLGWAAAAQGNHEEGIEELVCGLEASRATGAHMDDPYYLGLLGEAYLLAGETEAGMAAVAEGLEIARREHSMFYEPELHRLRAGLLLAMDRSDPESEVCLQQAIAIARRQGSRALELRAMVSLARLWRERGRGAQARGALAPLYESFDEGLDTPDLEEAARLLNPGRERLHRTV